MEIKPMYDTSTIEFATPMILQPRKLKTKTATDPKGVIPNGIYKVIKWEKRRQIFTFIFSSLIALTALLFIILYFEVLNLSWVSIIIPGFVFILSFYKLFVTLSEWNFLKKSVKRYSEDLAIGISDAPPFIARLYSSLIKKQVKHNWATFTLMFYGGLFTLTFWWLKDLSWWILEFDMWIRDLFYNPDLMVIIFTASLMLIVVLHLVLTVQRKKRIMEINSYYGSQMMPQTQVDEIKRELNKSLRRAFVWSVIILLLIPFVARFVLRTIRGKK